MKTLKIVTISLILTTTGCASLSREDCLYGDWFGIGITDGREGAIASNFVRHQDACRSHGVEPDKAQYLAGREQGLQQYCQLDNAIDIGLRGIRYQSVCPTALDVAMRRYNDTAYQVYQQRKSLKDLDEPLASKEKSLQDKKLSDKARQVIRDEIRSLDRKRPYLRDDLYSVEQQLDRLIYQQKLH